MLFSWYRSWTYRSDQQTHCQKVLEELTKRIKSTQQWHFGELKLNCCVEKAQFSVESECNQARFRCWHILLSEYYTNTSYGEQLLFYLLLLLPLFHTLPCRHLPCPTKLPISASQLCCNTWVHWPRALLSFPKDCVPCLSLKKEEEKEI